MKRSTVALFVFFLVPAGFLVAEDWTQWAGNDRQCTWSETGILKSFPKEGLKP
ncbi:MAG: pyrrolo-quinoline quinone, partial [Planctomycetaceae bacterium]|nr:pyrrolo-quinoline quinone [Planctomycetaceae bacterium]